MAGQSVFKTASMTNRTLSICVSGWIQTNSVITTTDLQSVTTLQLRRTHIMIKPPSGFATADGVFADEERFELSTNGLTSHCSAVELFIHIVDSKRFECRRFGLHADIHRRHAHLSV